MPTAGDAVSVRTTGSRLDELAQPNRTVLRLPGLRHPWEWKPPLAQLRRWSGYGQPRLLHLRGRQASGAASYVAANVKHEPAIPTEHGAPLVDHQPEHLATGFIVSCRCAKAD